MSKQKLKVPKPSPTTKDISPPHNNALIQQTIKFTTPVRQVSAMNRMEPGVHMLN